MNWIKAFEIRPSVVFSLDFPNSNIWSCFFFFFLIIDWYFIIPTCSDCKNFYSYGRTHLVPTGTQANANVEIETQTVIVEARISMCST